MPDVKVSPVDVLVAVTYQLKVCSCISKVTDITANRFLPLVNKLKLQASTTQQYVNLMVYLGQNIVVISSDFGN